MTSDSRPVARNVQSVTRLVEAWQKERHPAHRFMHSLIRAIGSPASLLVHLALFTTWLALNLSPHVRPFDRYPFSLLSMAVGLESILLTTAVLIVQNEMSRDNERRDHLQLQLSILGEQEMTQLLGLVIRMANRLGVSTTDPEVHTLAEPTDLAEVMLHIEEKLTPEPPVS